MFKFFISYLFVLAQCMPAHARLNDVERAEVFNKNLLVNGGFEHGKARWTESAGTFSIATSTPLIGSANAAWDAAASADTFTSTAVTIPTGMHGRNAVFSCLISVPSGTATHTLQAYDGTNILSSVTITSSTVPTRTSANFVMPSSGSISGRLYANADEPSIAVDDCFLGPSEGYNTANVSQATFIGSAYFATTTNCNFAVVSTSLAAMSDTDCPGPTVVSNPGPGTIQTTDANAPAVTVNGLPPGRYRAVFTGASGNSTGSASSLAIHDGTNTYGQIGTESSTNRGAFNIEAMFEYSSSGDRTFQLYGASGSSSQLIYNAENNHRTNFFLYRFPLSSEQAYKPDVSAQSWSGYHVQGCSWPRTSTSIGAPTDDASGCSLTESVNSNFGTVSTSGSVSPAITFTPKKAGRYSVCARTQLSASALGLATAQLVNGSTVIANESHTVNTGWSDTFTLCGIVVASSTSAVTLAIQTAVSTGTVTMAVTSPGTAAIDWSIFSIDQSLPAPLLVNSVVSSYSGVMGVESAAVSNAGAVSNEYGDWINGSCSIATTSYYTCTFQSGIFSQTPNCTATISVSAGTLDAQVTAISSSSITVRTYGTSTDTNTAQPFVIHCHGPR